MMIPTKKLLLLKDQHLHNIKKNWFCQSHNTVSNQQFINEATQWFHQTQINSISGWDKFPCQDIILGCTHFIESLLIKYHNRVQVLPDDYAYYRLIGIHATQAENLLPNVPLIISLPSWKYADLRPDWAVVLDICEQRNIDIHIDMAWITVAKDVHIDLDHPCIKSFAMSLSKYSMEWNRIGIRWSRQRTMDSITMFNHYQGAANQNQISCGAYIIRNLDRDYGWNTYQQRHIDVCHQHGLIPSKIVHVAHDPNLSQVWGISNLLTLGFQAPDSIDAMS